MCVSIGRYWYLFKRLTAVSGGRFYRFEHIVAYSSFKAHSKQASYFDARLFFLRQWKVYVLSTFGHKTSTAVHARVIWTMEIVEFIRTHATALPDLAKFALGMMIIWGVPLLSRRVRLPGIVGLLLSGVVIGPHVLGIFGEQRPVIDFFADLGKLLLMFVAGLEIDLAHFRQAQGK